MSENFDTSKLSAILTILVTKSITINDLKRDFESEIMLTLNFESEDNEKYLDFVFSSKLLTDIQIVSIEFVNYLNQTILTDNKVDLDYANKDQIINHLIYLNSVALSLYKDKLIRKNVIDNQVRNE